MVSCLSAHRRACGLLALFAGIGEGVVEGVARSIVVGSFGGGGRVRIHFRRVERRGSEDDGEAGCIERRVCACRCRRHSAGPGAI